MKKRIFLVYGLLVMLALAVFMTVCPSLAYAAEKTSLESASVKLDLPSSRYYKGTPYTPPVTEVKLGGVVLEEGKDYTVSYGENTHSDTGGQVYVDGIGDYEGRVTRTFAISKLPLDNYRVIVFGFPSNPKFPYTGSQVTPFTNGAKIYFIRDDSVWVELVADTDYFIGRITQTRAGNASSVDPGGYYITVNSSRNGTYSRDFQGSLKIEYSIRVASLEESIDPDSIVVNGGNPLVYNTYTWRPDVKGKVNGKDFSVTYSTGTGWRLQYEGDQINAGTFYAIVGRWNNFTYDGTYRIPVVIEPYNVNGEGVQIFFKEKLDDLSFDYDGTAHEPAVTVWYVKPSSGTRNYHPVEGTDYTVSYQNNTNAGTADASNGPRVVITFKGNYTGTYTIPFTINPVSISKASVSVANQTYDGKAKTPAPTVKLNGKTLKNNTDYSVSYKSNTNVGTATLTITGKGNYTGTVSKTFKITPANISKATVTGVTDKAWTGKAITQTPTVKLSGKTLKAGTDYTLSYKNNVNAGTATLTITGKGNYTGSVSKTFKITKAVEAKSVPVYWLQHKTAKENLYTTDKNEVAKLSEGNWINKGIVWYAPTTGTPVYRLYAKSINDHHYTANANEVKTLTAKGTWKVDSGKPMWYSGGNVRTYRMFNPTRNAKRLPGTHRFATSQAEVNTLKKQGWVMDDVKMYGVKVK